MVQGSENANTGNTTAMYLHTVWIYIPVLWTLSHKSSEELRGNVPVICARKDFV